MPTDSRIDSTANQFKFRVYEEIVTKLYALFFKRQQGLELPGGEAFFGERAAEKTSGICPTGL